MDTAPACTLFIVLALMVPAGMGVADTPPPANGDWTITDTTSIVNQTVVLNGNLTVKSGGRLELERVNLTINCSFNGQYAINVEPGGNLTINDSRIKGRDWMFAYKFLLFDNTIISNSFLTDIYGIRDPASGGIEIHSDNVSIIHTVIDYNIVGISIFDSSPQISNCNVELNIYGISCYGNAKPFIIGNEFLAQDIAIINGNDSSAVIINNTFDGDTIDIDNIGGSYATIKGNNMSAWICIRNAENSTPYIEENTIVRNWVYGDDIGIANYDHSDPEIINNSITSMDPAILNRDNSTPNIRKNMFIDNKVGIHTSNASRVEVLDNLITGSVYAGLMNDGAATVNISNNTISKGGNIGILNGNSGKTRIINNSIMNTTTGSGIRNTNSSDVVVEDCTIRGAGLNGIENDLDAVLTVHESSIQNCTGNGIVVAGNATAEIINNTVAGNGLAGIKGKENSTLTILRNKILENGECAIGGHNNAFITAKENDLANNLNGIELSSDNGDFSQNEISGGTYGITLVNCSPVLANNAVSGATFGARLSRSNATIAGTNFSDIEKNPVYCTDYSSPLIVNSTISQSRTGYDFYVAGASHPTTLNTTFNRSLVKVEDTSSLCIKWYLQLEIADAKGRPLDQANLSFEGMESFRTKTDAEGVSPWLPVYDRIVTKVEVEMAGYKITVEKNDDESEYVDVMIDRTEKRVVLFDFAPVIGPIPEKIVQEDLPTALDLSEFISDRDHDIGELWASLCFGSEKNKYVSLNGMALILNYSLPVVEDTIYFLVSDGIKNSTSEVKVHVTSVNDPPVILEIPPRLLYENVSYILNMSQYVSDEEDPTPTITVVDSPYATVTGSNITFCYPQGILTDTVDIIARDRDGASTLAKININIAPVNDPPTITEFPKINPTEGIELVINLSKLIADPDSPFGQIFLATNSSYCTVEGLSLRFYYPEGIITDFIRVTVSDGLDNTSYERIIPITPVDNPPGLVTSPKINVLAGRSYLLDLWPLVTDPDTPKEKLRIYSSNPFVTVSGYNLTFTFPKDRRSANEKVELNLSDGVNNLTVDLYVSITGQEVRVVSQYAVYIYILVPLAIIGTVAGIIVYRRWRYGWYEMKRAMVVNRDGRMLASAGEGAAEDDELLVSSMLTAVQQFIEEAMKKDKAGSIKEFQYEDMKIAVERGTKIYLAVFLKGYATDGLRKEMKEIVDLLENRYNKEITEWDGRLKKTKFVQEAESQLKRLSGKK